MNRADVVVNLRDVNRNLISDDVEIDFYNQRVQSLSQQFNVKLRGKPAVLPEVPAFPTGLAEVFINPARYRYKSIFINVAGGEANSIDEDFFVDSAKARPTQMDFDDLSHKKYAADLLRILKASKITKPFWDSLDKRNRATILNLSAKMLKETTRDKQPLIAQVDSIDQTWLDKKHRERIFAPVQADLLTKLRNYMEKFEPVSGALHHFPAPWTPVTGINSFKTRDSAGNIQLTFATDGKKNYLADIDLDDHKGIAHAADVLKHKITGKETDPYDIHEILIYFQHLDPEYKLI